MKRFIKISILSLLFSCLLITKVNAGAANVSISGNGTIESGKTFTLNVIAANASVTDGSGGLMSAGGTISSSNATCVQLVSVSVTDGMANNGVYAYSFMNGKLGTVTLATATFKAVGSNCTATIKSDNTKLAFTDGAKITTGTVSKNINVVTYSSNNNLSSLTVSPGSLSPAFSANQTNYTVNVGADVTNINIGATVQDAKSTLAGAGNKKLNFGSNKIAITVKAQNGSTKVYNINVIRQDNRASNANLKSLTINGGTLTPGFESNTTEYSVSVPYSISKLDVKAEPVDSTSKVSINSPDLVAEGTTNVTIKVTAENGASKNYVIKVTRGKDPNKKLNTDNDLLKLETSIGILSPAFEKAKNNYFIYLPYEIETIDFNYEVSDKTYATVEKNGPDKLKPDSANKYTFAVKAEDESIKTYSVTVYRAKNPEELDGASNSIEGSNSIPKLKSLKIKNGKLISEFDPNTNSYEYTKKKDFSYEYELEDENTYVNVVEQDSNIYIILESETGDINVYCLHQKKTNSTIIILAIIIVVLIAIITVLLLKIKQLLDGEDTKSKKDKKTKKNK